MKKSFLLAAGALLALQLSPVQSLKANNPNPAQEVHALNNARVTEYDVIAYLESKGYRNVKVFQMTAEGNYICGSDFPYNTIVFVQNGIISGSEDIN
jgi:hypothetical protein